ncbi:phage tail protein I [Asticcacaulis endophyticus]|uniref:Phage tail protein I n=1 Tax=Asticcacaulis endophyticus TaxID=1395890 RepID=A0A918USY8_9CAUL|nr:phage tail protein I [Asticcacaulis endophyticus]GGZ32046.1 phage tail protein I [Asticcacaulis endophyticus]
MTSVLPPNASALERAFEQVMSPGLPVPLRDLWDADTCPAVLLPWLAFGLSIDGWSADWPEAVKRQRIRTAIDIQRRKGSVKSVRDIVTVFGGQIALREWWQTEPKGDPHTFTINLSLNDGAGAPATAAYIDAVINEVRRTKPVRSHFEFIQGLNVSASVGIKAVARVAVYARLSLTAPAAA